MTLVCSNFTSLSALPALGDVMSLTRRDFARTVGLGTVGMFSSPFIIGRGHEAAAFEPPLPKGLDLAGIIRISSNENARGPGPNAMAALHQSIGVRAGRGYPADNTTELVTAIAEQFGVEDANVVIGTGSTALLVGAVRAFCSPSKGLVTASPTYGTPDQTARRIGAPVTMIPVDASLGLDLRAMADAATGAGLVFFCNPNNPTGTAHPITAVQDFLRRVKRNSPETAILIDEAYIDYSMDPTVRSAVSLTQEFPGVFVTRTFSKAHGMAGLRIGYAVAQEETIGALRGAWNYGDLNMITAAAAIASLKDTGHMDDERRENARVREFTLSAFRSMGFDARESHTNHIFLDLKRPASEFRDACLAQNIQVGRDFPPMEHTYSRISLGTMDEMEQAVDVFRNVLK